MKTRVEGNKVFLTIGVNITSVNAHEVEKDIKETLSSFPGMEPVIDAEDMTYISSAGLRVLVAVPRSDDHVLTICNAGPELYEILEITGLIDIFNVQKKMKCISVEGCEVIGKGAFGVVYRLDEETVVKVYNRADCLDMIRNERILAKQAFIAGIPTAISYDIVKVGEGYGSVFELLRAENLNNIVISHPEEFDELTGKYLELMKKIHNVETGSGMLPSAKDIFLKHLDNLGSVLPREAVKKISDLLNKLPPDNHVVHGDIQMKNVMVTDHELMLIDMETLCTGDPVFELQGMFITYRAFNEDEPDNTLHFVGFDEQMSKKIWERVLNGYFEGLTNDQIREQENKIKLLGYIRFLDMIVTHNLTKPELKKIRIEHSIEHINYLLDVVNNLAVRVIT